MPNPSHAAPTADGEPITGSQGWGFEALEVDANALAQGRVVVSSAHGTWPDGSAFSIGPNASSGNATALPVGAGDASEAMVYVCQQAGQPPTLTLAPPAGARALPALRLQPDVSAWALDCTFVPPTRHVRASKPLVALHHAVMARVEARAVALAQRFGSLGSGVGEVADFMLLMALNPALAELRHLDSLPDLHPERLFESLLRLHAVLSTLQEQERLPARLAPYRHVDCGPPFEALGTALRTLLSVVLAATGARQIALEQRKYGIYTARLDPADKNTKFVLEVQATMPSELLRTRFPQLVKIGPADAIRELVNIQLPGVALRALPAVPRQLPVKNGATYFELDLASSPLAPKVLESGLLALHVAGEFPQLMLALWQID